MSDAEYVAIPGWCGFEKEDGAVAIVGREDALVLAQHYEPFAVYRLAHNDGPEGEESLCDHPYYCEMPVQQIDGGESSE